ncbi:DUF4913 domain-containing protein [Micromonospora sp. NBRC 101691]|uniref:DUF4913 domain-containing protein n=1 Tax=Micromonospora TaxID=1873 RepID=UPI0024A153A5|nr:DUF4913 domain-containing protein [Micromonospora sp. NBRC 101691]GLY24665.1 hypothetical protein Misp04_43970 [Micromonospora sp. NBRC 101691]
MTSGHEFPSPEPITDPGFDTAPGTGAGDGNGPGFDSDPPPFILYLDGPAYAEALGLLAMWVHHLLLPVYGRETSSNAPWCPRWWLHPEAVAQLHGLWMAWQELTAPDAGLCGPANWHRDYLNPVLASLRDAAGPFAGCKPGSHRAKDVPTVEAF